MHLDGSKILTQDLMDRMKKAGLSASPVDRIMPGVSEVVLALGSAGAFTAFYNIVSTLLSTNKNREITIKYNGSSISIKGHSVPEEQELLEQIAPQLKTATRKPTKSKHATKTVTRKDH